MSKKFKDTDYLMLSSMLRAREAGMLSRERMDRMLSAPSFAEAAKLLVDCGYEDMSSADATGIDAALSRRRAAVFTELSGMVPQPEAVDIFRLKYDYHNLKVLVKSAAAGVDGEYLLSGCGRGGRGGAEIRRGRGRAGRPAGRHGRGIHGGGLRPQQDGQPPAGRLRTGRGLLRRGPEPWPDAAAAPSSRAMCSSLIDSANLRTAVRTVRMGKDREFMRHRPWCRAERRTPRGWPWRRRAARPSAALFHATPLAAAAAVGADAMKGGPLTDFELACDNAVSAYLSAAKMKPFGIEAVVEYIWPAGAGDNRRAHDTHGAPGRDRAGGHTGKAA